MGSNIDRNLTKLITQAALLLVAILTLTAASTLPRHRREAASSAASSELIEPWRPYYITHTCEWSYMSISCPLGRVISVARATYGRQDLSYCPHLQSGLPSSEGTTCPGLVRSPLNIIKNKCNGNTTCTIPVYRGLFGNPCPTTFEYLEVYYACVARSSRGHRNYFS